MPKRTFSEIVLALFSGRERAAAIYGDLAEMGANRGRAWFRVAYARTAIALAWRAVLAPFAGFWSFYVVYGLIELCAGSSHQANIVLWIAAMMMGRALGGITAALLLFVPYAIVRYGWRDKMVRLACAMFLLDAISVCMILAPSYLACTILAAIPLGALSFKAWRGPAFVLVATIAAGGAVAACLLANSWSAITIVALPAMALVCTSLRWWLVERHSEADMHVQAKTLCK